MPIDAGIYSQFAPRVQSPLDVQNGLAQQSMNMLAAQGERLKLQQTQQDMADSNALRAAYRSGIDPTTPQGQQALIQAAPLQAPKLIQGMADLQKTRSETSLNASKSGEQDALAASHTLDTTIKKHDYAVQQLGSVNTPTDALAWAAKQHASGTFSDDEYLQGVKSLVAASSDPNAFAQWKQQTLQGGASAVEQLKMKQQAQIAADQQTGENARNAATNKTHLAAASMAQAGENQRAALGRGTQLTIAGLNPDGTVSGNTEQMAQAIAKGQVAPLSGFALARPAGQQVMARVMAINPDYDATSYGAKAQAAKAFTSGPQGNALRSFAVAGQHLDQLGTLVDALGNNNVQLVNKIGNEISQQFGGTAPTNFDAAKDIVSKEVIKAIVGSGGGVGEREELSKQMSNAKTPAQLKGVISQYRSLMGAQHDALMQQRQAAGIPDATAPQYAPTAPAPSGFKYIGPVK